MIKKMQTILLVEDEESILDLAVSILQDEGYRVLSARHSDEALLLLEKEKQVQLLVTDVKMDPYLTGCELAKCMRLLCPEIKVVYISGLANNSVVLQEIEEGRATFLPKPFTPSALIEKVKSTLAMMQPSF